MTHSLSESLQGGSPLLWANDWLRVAGFPVTEENLRVTVSWEIAESGGGGGMWNPLNTTQGGYAGETDANSVGVKNYARRQDGISANAKVIHNGYYPHVVAAFMAGDNAQKIIDAIVVSPWGTRRINLVPPVGPVPQPVPPKPKEEPMLFKPASGDKALNYFSGAKVDIAAMKVEVTGDCTCTPNPAAVAIPGPWLGAIGPGDDPKLKPGEFVVVGAGKHEYKFTLT